MRPDDRTPCPGGYAISDGHQVHHCACEGRNPSHRPTTATLRDLLAAARRAGIVLKRDRDGESNVMRHWRALWPGGCIDVFGWRTSWEVAIWREDGSSATLRDVTPQRVAAALRLLGVDLDRAGTP